VVSFRWLYFGKGELFPDPWKTVVDQENHLPFWECSPQPIYSLFYYIPPPLLVQLLKLGLFVIATARHPAESPGLQALVQTPQAANLSIYA